MRLALLLCLVACGKPTHLSFSSVDASWQEDFEAVANGLDGLVSIDRGGYYRLVAEKQPQGWGGHAQGFVLSLLPYDEAGRLVGPSMHRTMVAHELGHLLGLDHMTHGIMRTSPGPECRGREAECLLEALNE